MSAYTQNTSIEVVGIKDALRTLNRVDKVARRQITKDYKELVAPMINTARTLTPNEPPLSGMGHAWKPQGRKEVFPWDDATSDKAMKPFVSGKKPREFRGFTSHLTTFGVRWSAPGATVVELSGEGNVPTVKGRQMVESLTARYGQPGRFFWRAFTQHEQEVQDGVAKLMKEVMRMLNERLD